MQDTTAPGTRYFASRAGSTIGLTNEKDTVRARSDPPYYLAGPAFLANQCHGICPDRASAVAGSYVNPSLTITNEGVETWHISDLAKRTLPIMLACRLMKRTQEPEQATPKFPYTTKPSSLRKFLGMIPQKPKPVKLNETLIKSWGFKDTNDQTIIRVLKAVGLVGADNTPTPDYVAFMNKEAGPTHLAQKVRQLYPAFFEVSHTPHKEPNDTLESLFNIHSGGGSGTMAFQIQTFKALCDHADFSGSAAPSASVCAGGAGSARNLSERGGATTGGPTIHIDLHIHLPGNKSRRDYEYMFEDIARYIYGRAAAGSESTEGSE